MTDTQKMIEEFLAGGGEITRLRPATESDVKKASRKWYHKEKALCGSERSKKIVSKEEEKEEFMIFSKSDRWKVD
jgi:hypothetical protein|tara:strand:- start:845 stop:1069 length:225 start_codon:yes stop_codon:yes gene_type:complete